MKRFLLVLPLVVFMFGCPQTRENVALQGTQALMMKIIDKAKIDHSQLSAEGNVTNPSYEYEWFGGVGPYSKGSIRVVGVEVRANAVAAGVGEAEPDADMREKIWQILQRDEINSEERKNAVIAAVLQWMTKDPIRDEIARVLTDPTLSSEQMLEQIKVIIKPSE